MQMPEPSCTWYYKDPGRNTAAPGDAGALHQHRDRVVADLDPAPKHELGHARAWRRSWRTTPLIDLARLGLFPNPDECPAADRRQHGCVVAALGAGGKLAHSG